MNRTTTSPVAASAMLVLIMVGVPVWLFSRVTASLLPTQSADLLLFIAVVVWLFVAKAILDRDNTIDSVTINSKSPTWHAHRLVDNSIVGVGFAANAAAKSSVAEDAQHLHAVTAPYALSSDQLPPQLPAFDFGLSESELEEAAPRSVPMLQSEEPAALSITETQEYIVARGDTFWSIADVVLGDGRDWQQLQQLNLGRQVASDIVLTLNHELRIGWSILLPLHLEASTNQEIDHVA